MESLLLNLVVLVRPLASMKFLDAVFVPLGGGLFLLLMAAFLIRAAVHKHLRFNAVDAIIVAFTGWCVAVGAIYYESTNLGDLTKLLVPLLSYTAAKNIVTDLEAYRRLLIWMFVGFLVPTIVSAAAIAIQHPIALDMVNYWTNVPRWEGLYTHSHNLGHSMTLLLIALIIFLLVRNASAATNGFRSKVEIVLVTVLGIAALYALYMSQVRSAILGLLTFVSVFTFLYKKRFFLIGVTVVATVAVLTMPYWFSAMFPELDMRKRGIEVSTLDLGSGRPRFWLNDLFVFASLPLDQKLGGVGIGATRAGNMELYGHNDWLSLLTQTGSIGLLLYLALQVVIARMIFRMPRGNERFAFVALFCAVNLMMLVSNSYAWRIQVSQLYFIMLALVDVRNRQGSVSRMPVPESLIRSPMVATSGHYGR